MFITSVQSATLTGDWRSRREKVILIGNSQWRSYHHHQQQQRRPPRTHRVSATQSRDITVRKQQSLVVDRCLLRRGRRYSRRSQRDGAIRPDRRWRHRLISVGRRSRCSSGRCAVMSTDRRFVGRARYLATSPGAFHVHCRPIRSPCNRLNTHTEQYIRLYST